MVSVPLLLKGTTASQGYQHGKDQQKAASSIGRQGNDRATAAVFCGGPQHRSMPMTRTRLAEVQLEH